MGLIANFVCIGSLRKSLQLEVIKVYFRQKSFSPGYHELSFSFQTDFFSLQMTKDCPLPAIQKNTVNDSVVLPNTDCPFPENLAGDWQVVQLHAKLPLSTFSQL